jgi:cell division protein FtsI (penicillin-binding protein 3)
MMEMVLSEGGTGVEAALDGYSACGKTGTAQKIGKDGTYSQDRYIASFAGFTPVEDPRLTIVVVVDEPQGNYYGGSVAAPVFREIAQAALGYLNVRPSERAPKMTVSEKTKETG